MCLVAVAPRLGAASVPDTVGRLGGDEFVVICEDVGGEADALRVAERLTTALAIPVRVAGRDLAIAASIGVAVSASHTADPATLIAEADGAMFWAKRPGRSLSLLGEGMRIGSGGVLVDRLGELLEGRRAGWGAMTEIPFPTRPDMVPLDQTTVLVVDDDPSVRRLLSLAFTLKGFAVCSAADGEDALQCARREQPAVVVLDAVMPGLGGIETCRLLPG